MSYEFDPDLYLNDLETIGAAAFMPATNPYFGGAIVPPVKPTHTVTIQTLGNGWGGYQAQCSCKWKGPVRTLTSRHAQKDADHHTGKDKDPQ
jgi:hypothetical protein